MTPPAFDLYLPDRRETPVVFSSPHSGKDYPQSLMRRTALDERSIRTSEDAFVDVLFSQAPQSGAPLIAARVPRAFIDLNRSADELDPALIEGILRAPHNPRVSSGLGVIPRVVANGRAIYRGKLPLREVQERLEQVWHPYHDALRKLLDESLSQFGEAVLVDCHSMPHEAIETHARSGQPRPDVVLGDRFGAAAGRAIVEEIEAAFEEAGLRVARNSPFAGAYIAQAYGRPSRNQHVVQVEIDRSLYMDEATIQPRADFVAFHRLISGIIARIAANRSRGVPLAAE